jgi:hypothetical protein
MSYRCVRDDHPRVPGGAAMTPRPTVLMVCEACRAGDPYISECDTAGCVFWGYQRGERPLKPARSREEMIAASADALMDRVAVMGCTCYWDEEGNSPPSCRCEERMRSDLERHAEAVLIAAGVIEAKPMSKYAPPNDEGLKPWVVTVSDFGRKYVRIIYAETSAAAKYAAVGRQQHVSATARRATPEDLEARL